MVREKGDQKHFEVEILYPLWAKRRFIMTSTISSIFEMLPKTDCEKCAYTSCCAYATELAHGRAPLSGCPALAEEKKTIIAQIIKEHRTEAQAIALPREEEAARRLLSVIKKVALVPVQALWLLIFTFPLTAPIFFLVIWLSMR